MRLPGFCLKGEKTARQTYLRACIGAGQPMPGQGCRRLAACLHRWPRQRNKQACRQVCSQTKTARQTDRQRGKQAGRQTDRQGSKKEPKPKTGKDRKNARTGNDPEDGPEEDRKQKPGKDRNRFPDPGPEDRNRTGRGKTAGPEEDRNNCT